MSYLPKRNRESGIPPCGEVRVKDGGSPAAGPLQNRIAIPKITDTAATIIITVLAVTPVAALRIQACVPKKAPESRKSAPNIKSNDAIEKSRRK
jgi:hypothetical protein